MTSIANNVRKAATFMVLASVLVFNAPIANATDKVNPNIEVKYMGTVNNSPLFQVEFNNEEGDEVSIYLRDAHGNLLYSEVTKDKKFSRKFRLEDIELDDNKITLHIRSKKGNLSETFQINKSVRQVEEVVVNKL